ncbi:hypothetical protein V8F20_003955 [Naviculisporaceae sp. PSN 640]
MSSRASDSDDPSETTPVVDQREEDVPTEEEQPQVTVEIVVHFENLRLDHYPTLDTMLLDCMIQIWNTRTEWHAVVNPILRDLVEITRAKESTPSPFLRIVRELVDRLHEINRLGAQLFHALYQVLTTVRTDWVNIMRAEGLADQVLAEPQAWTYLFYVWGGYRAFFRRLVDDLLPILRGWHNWDWAHPGARADGLRLVAFLVRRRMLRLEDEYSWTEPIEHMASIWDFCPDAAAWLIDAGAIIDQQQDEGENNDEHEGEEANTEEPQDEGANVDEPQPP